MQLSAVLGHPDQPHFPHPPPLHSPHPLPPSPHPPFKKKSPSQLHHHERRKHEALAKEEQISKKTTEKDVEGLKIGTPDSEATGKVTATKKDSVKETENSMKLNCSQCNLKFKFGKCHCDKKCKS